MNLSTKSLNEDVVNNLKLETGLDLVEVSTFLMPYKIDQKYMKDPIRVDFLITKSGLEIQYGEFILPEGMTEEEATQEVSKSPIYSEGMTFDDFSVRLFVFVDNYLNKHLESDYSNTEE